ncbi:hypothetical protein CbuK_1908 [Coxiella burnetii CbuK_Q154]|nr:hypothetical protein CbuK_1908 [Coxiella burnetii CbuK_Q154]AIT64099.1 hypothetical protein CBNA_1901 [Coxiella burnetii str. Namibia]
MFLHDTSFSDELEEDESGKDPIITHKSQPFPF